MRMDRLVVVGLLVIVSTCSADIVVLTDGRTFEGRVLEQTPREIEIDCMVEGVRSRLRLDRTLVRSIERRALPPGFFAPPAPRTRRRRQVIRYTVIPLHGTIGEVLQAEDLQEVLADVRGRSDVVVLDVRTPGGWTAEARAMADVLARFDDDFRFVALVGRGEGAALFPVLACDAVLLREGGVLGGPPAPRPAEAAGLLPDAEAGASATVAAELASLAARKGWSPAIARAMVLPEASLLCRKGEDGAPVVVDARTADGRAGSGLAVLDDECSVFTITGDAAARCGFPPLVPAGTTAADLGARLAPDRDWRPGPRAGERAHRRAARRWEVFREGFAQVEGLWRAAAAAEEEAARADPEQYAYEVKTFTIWSSSGPSPRVVTKPTPASWQKWHAYTDASIAAWRRADAALGRLEAIAAEAGRYHRVTRFSVPEIQARRAHCAEQARRLQRLRSRGPR